MRRDTLALRLAALMWAALVLSHLAAWGLFRLTHPMPPEIGAVPVPTFPSLPPTPGLAPRGAPMLTGGALLLDYGIRFVVIALAAWWGSSWLARPMSRLVSAAESLGPSLARGEVPPALDEQRGTAEVRRAAVVFNSMAAQIRQLFEARGLMIAAISHDLRTPLTRLRMRLETAVADRAQRRRFAADVEEMNTLIDAVLEVFRPLQPGAAPAQRVDLKALLQALLDDQAEQGSDVRLQADAVVLATQPLLLKRIVANLVGNALRYGGSAEVTLRRAGAEVVLGVDDTGPGIPPEQLEAVMQPFVRLEGSRNRATGGTGLGLFIARELAARLGGTLMLRNRVGGGLHAELRLPATG